MKRLTALLSLSIGFILAGVWFADPADWRLYAATGMATVATLGWIVWSTRMKI